MRMALTPGIASAALVSMRLTRACGIGLSSSLQNSMPSALEVFRIARTASHFRDQVRRQVIRADEFRFCHLLPSQLQMWCGRYPSKLRCRIRTVNVPEQQPPRRPQNNPEPPAFSPLVGKVAWPASVAWHVRRHGY